MPDDLFSSVLQSQISPNFHHHGDVGYNLQTITNNLLDQRAFRGQDDKRHELTYVAASACTRTRFSISVLQITHHEEKGFIMRLTISACFSIVFLFVAFSFAGKAVAADAPDVTAGAATPDELFARKNLVAWCIVPFDAKKRGPKERAEMLQRLGLSKLAYDWRDEHVRTFEDEIIQTKKCGIEIVAFWGMHNDFAPLVRKYGLKPQFWVIAGSPQNGTNEEKVAQAAEGLMPIVNQTRELGCRLALYNHGGWSGEPDNMVAVVKYLRERKQADHVGIVYNLHHGHGHLTDFPEALARMKPYLFCLNLNGMIQDGEAKGKKILPLGQGDLELQLLKTILASGYRGPIGILNHTDEDAEGRLQDNLDGLDWLVKQLKGESAGSKPTPRTWKAQ